MCWVERPLNLIKTGSIATDGHVYFKIVKNNGTIKSCQLLHGNPAVYGYSPNQDGVYDFLNCELIWTIVFEPEKPLITEDEEYRQHLLQQIERTGKVSCESEDGTPVCETVSMWSETEAEHIEATEMYVREGVIYINGFNDHGKKVTNVPVSDYRQVEEFLKEANPHFEYYKPSYNAIKGTILKEYQDYLKKLTEQVTRLLQAAEKSELVTDDKRRLFIQSGVATVELPSGDKRTNFETIIETIQKLKA